MNNNLPEKKNGNDYLERIRKGTNREFERELRTNHRAEFEAFLQKTIQETTGETHRSVFPSETGRAITPDEIDQNNESER